MEKIKDVMILNTAPHGNGGGVPRFTAPHGSGSGVPQFRAPHGNGGGNPL